MKTPTSFIIYLLICFLIMAGLIGENVYLNKKLKEIRRVQDSYAFSMDVEMFKRYIAPMDHGRIAIDGKGGIYFKKYEKGER